MCNAEGCDRKKYAKGYCARHYYQEKRLGSVNNTKIISYLDRYNEEGLRICTKCRRWLKDSDFRNLKINYCFLCLRLQRYKLTVEQYEQLLTTQNGLCLICMKNKAKVIDHDHRCCPSNYSCGKCVRGILCLQCNASIGQLTEEGILRAVNYINQKYTGGKVL